jgi:hypothetical protein
MKIQYLSFILLLITVHCGMYQKYYDEAYSIAAAMTLDQKLGQTIQLDLYSVTGKNGTDATLASKLHLGSVLIGGNGAPDANGNLVTIPDMDEQKTISIYQNATMDRWQKLAEKFNNISL